MEEKNKDKDYKNKDKDENRKDSKHYGKSYNSEAINVNNIHVHTDGGKSDKKKDEKKDEKDRKKKCCECRGFVNSNVAAANIRVNICPDCNFRNSVISLLGIVATEISEPTCGFTAANQPFLFVSGTAMQTTPVGAGPFYLILVEQPPGLNDTLIFHFNNVTAGTSLVATIPIPDAQLTITRCNERCKHGNSSFDVSGFFAPEFGAMANTALTDLNTDNNVARIATFLPNGEIEVERRISGEQRKKSRDR